MLMQSSANSVFWTICPEDIFGILISTSSVQPVIEPGLNEPVVFHFITKRFEK